MNHIATIQTELSVNPIEQTRMIDGKLEEIFPAIRPLDHLPMLIEGTTLDIAQEIERLLNTFTKSELALLTASLLMDNFSLHSTLTEIRLQLSDAERLEREAMAKHTGNQN